MCQTVLWALGISCAKYQMQLPLLPVFTDNSMPFVSLEDKTPFASCLELLADLRDAVRLGVGQDWA